MSSKSRKSAKKSNFGDFGLNYFGILTRYLKKNFLAIFNKPNSIVQINGLHVIYSVIFIRIFDVKVVYTIFPRVYTSIYYGMLNAVFLLIDSMSGSLNVY